MFIRKPKYGSLIDINHPLCPDYVWMFNEGGGNLIYNIGKRIRPAGMLKNGPTWTGDGLYFDGSNDWAELGNNLDLSPGLSIFCIINPIVSDTTARSIIQRRNAYDSINTGSNIDFFIVYNNSVILASMNNAAGNSFDLLASSQFTLNSKNYLSVSFPGNGKYSSMFLNGKRIISGTQNRDRTTNNAMGTQIGSRWLDNNSSYFNGYWYVLYIYNRGLLDQEQISLFANPYQFIKSPYLQYYFGVSGGVTSITGQVAATLAAVTSSETGEVKVSGSLAATLASLVSSETGGVRVSGNLAATLSQLISSETGGVLVSGTVASTLAQLTSSETGNVNVSGVISSLVSQVTSSNTGKVKVSGTVAAELLAITAALLGTSGGLPVISGSVNATLGIISALNEGVVKISGGVVANMAALTADVDGTTGNPFYKLYYIMKL